MNLQKILYAGAFTLWGFGAILLYAHVYDVEPHDPAHDYEIERREYEHSHSGDWERDFPDYGTWSDQKDQKVAELRSRFSDGIVQAFDVFDLETRQDTNCGHAGAAGADWATCERE